MYKTLYLVHYGTKGMHWYVRNYQNYDGSLTEEGRLRYLKNSKKVAEKAYSMTIGNTEQSQQNRYHRWYRSNVDKEGNRNKKTISENVKARKREGANYINGLKTFYDLMKKENGASIPNKYYNEDLLWKTWHDLYTNKIIEPAFKRYTAALEVAKNDIEGFSVFSANKEKMKAYGYSEDMSNFAKDNNIDMAHYAYANYLMQKKKSGV